ncbi:MAG: hypothetical protein NTY19_36620 [Planctomycetota bacterium]|nr:hypothetical protein [Planctomycetota bacterium]
MPGKPIHELRRGLIKVRIWRKRTRSGLRHTIAVTRLFRNGDVWKESSRFGRDEIPLLRLALDEAHTWIFRNSQPTKS